ncbi:hypothetical protein BDZ94DRAFT_1259874 [Collybia nuda]|uniref:DUF202 domain-containing protein n=1 Tax=Collybia nuda TaxID=64659 RepID=A0A9P6CEM0_9AGAR|nr:hypothetical protein BDZ94DRAFT_1259874 [Collybia nuda]
MHSTHDADDICSVETTPLIPKPNPIPKRIRSRSNSLGFLPNRRLRTKSRPSKLSDKPHIDTTHNDKGLTDDGSDAGSSPRTRTSSNAAAVNWPPSCDTPPLPTSIRRGIGFPQISLKLENSGSVARDHLASERTFLAYMRTSLALASSGVALVQLFTVASASSPSSLIGSERKLHTYIRPLGATTIAMGLIVLFIGVARYFAIQTALTKGYFPAPRLVMGVIALAMAVLVTLTFGILVAGKLEPNGLI